MVHAQKGEICLQSDISGKTSYLRFMKTSYISCINLKLGNWYNLMHRMSHVIGQDPVSHLSPFQKHCPIFPPFTPKIHKLTLGRALVLLSSSLLLLVMCCPTFTFKKTLLLLCSLCVSIQSFVQDTKGAELGSSETIHCNILEITHQ
jgi:hypothetical protein